MRRCALCAVVKKNILPFTVTLQSKLWPQRFRVPWPDFLLGGKTSPIVDLM
jgi:hypothetical protein